NAGQGQVGQVGPAREQVSLAPRRLCVDELEGTDVLIDALDAGQKRVEHLTWRAPSGPHVRNDRRYGWHLGADETGRRAARPGYLHAVTLARVSLKRRS